MNSELYFIGFCFIDFLNDIVADIIQFYEDNNLSYNNHDMHDGGT